MPYFARPHLLADHHSFAPIKVWSVRWDDDEQMYEYMTIDLSNSGNATMTESKLHELGWRFLPKGTVVCYGNEKVQPAHFSHCNLCRSGLLILNLRDIVMREKSSNTTGRRSYVLGTAGDDDINPAGIINARAVLQEARISSIERRKKYVNTREQLSYNETCKKQLDIDRQMLEDRIQLFEIRKEIVTNREIELVSVKEDLEQQTEALSRRENEIARRESEIARREREIEQEEDVIARRLFDLNIRAEELKLCEEGLAHRERALNYYRTLNNADTQQGLQYNLSREETAVVVYALPYDSS